VAVILELRSFDSVREIRFTGSARCSDDLHRAVEIVSTIIGLESLELPESPGFDCAPLGSLIKLKSFRFRIDTGIGMLARNFLPPLPNLNLLQIGGVFPTPQCAFPELRELSLMRCEKFGFLASCPKLRELAIVQPPPFYSNAKYLDSFPESSFLNLEKLYVESCVTDDFIMKLKTMKKLKNLTLLGNVDVNDETMAVIAGLAVLYLRIDFRQGRATHLRQLSQMNSLEEIYLSDTTREVCAGLANHPTIRFVTLSSLNFHGDRSRLSADQLRNFLSKTCPNFQAIEIHESC